MARQRRLFEANDPQALKAEDPRRRRSGNRLDGTPPPPKTGNGSPSASAKAAPDGKIVADDSGASMFVLAYGIAHDGGGVMRCRWPPESLRARARTGAGASTRSAADTAAAAAEGQGAEALGLLAAVFYDGSIR